MGNFVIYGKVKIKFEKILLKLKFHFILVNDKPKRGDMMS
jgi:hypothetical protein